MGDVHVASHYRHRARTPGPLATALRALRGLPESCAWFRLAGTAAGEQAAALCLVLLHHVSGVLLATGPEVNRHG